MSSRGCVENIGNKEYSFRVEDLFKKHLIFYIRNGTLKYIEYFGCGQTNFVTE